MSLLIYVGMDEDDGFNCLVESRMSTGLIHKNYIKSKLGIIMR